MKGKRGERLERADMEVIWGEKGKGKVRKVGGKGSGLGGLTRAEAGRLLEFVVKEMDWEGAIGFVRGEAGEVGEVRERGGMEAKAAGRISTPEGLKAHWRDVLGKRLVELYED